MDKKVLLGKGNLLIDQSDFIVKMMTKQMNERMNE